MRKTRAGLGQTFPSPRRASASAARIIRESSAMSVMTKLGIGPNGSRRHAGAPYEAGVASIAIRRDLADILAEILRFTEIAVDRSKPDIGDLIEGRQRLHDQFADHVAGNLGFARAFELAHQGIDDALDPLRLDRPFSQRDVDRAGELIAVERLTLPIFLDDGQLAQLNPLEGGEAGGAIRTEPAPPYPRPIVGRPRILDLGVIRAAERTTHLLLLLAPTSWGTLVSSFDAVRVNRKAIAQPSHLAAHPRFERGIATRDFRQPAQHFGDPFPDLAEFSRAEAAGSAGRRPEANAGSHRRLLRVERDAVLVAGHAGTL